MKFIIETEDKYEVELIAKIDEFRTFIIDLIEDLRHKIKYEEHSEDYYNAIEEIRTWIYECINEKGLQRFMNFD